MHSRSANELSLLGYFARGTLKVHIFNFAKIITSTRAFTIQSIHLNIHIFFYPPL